MRVALLGYRWTESELRKGPLAETAQQMRLECVPAQRNGKNEKRNDSRE